VATLWCPQVKKHALASIHKTKQDYSQTAYHATMRGPRTLRKFRHRFVLRGDEKQSSVLHTRRESWMVFILVKRCQL
jgi:hypothetical protein